VEPLATLVAVDKARQLAARGKDNMDLSQSGPHHVTPPHIVEAGVKALREGMINISSSQGLPDFRHEMAEKLLASLQKRQVMMTPQLVEQVLEKMGFSASLGTDLAGLSAIYGRWCRKIPFDNIQKRLFYSGPARGPLPGHNSEDFFQKWLAYGTGGTCWANSHAMHDLLEALGFDVVRVAATMLATPDVVGPSHGTVFVSVDNRPYMVDGSMQTEQPVPVEEGGPQEVCHPAQRVHLEHREGHW
jgi:hypothetical protein